MNIPTSLRQLLWGGIFASLSAGAALAGPGAHGPNGEHLDTPSTQHAQAEAMPRLESASETFELVARMEPTPQLVIELNHYESNAPVLGARIEVESENHKAQAQFDATHGHYAVTDAAWLKAVSAPGQHSLLFTISAGQESDLLEGSLSVPEHLDHALDHHGHGLRAPMLIGGLLVVAAAAVLGWRWRVSSRRNTAREGEA